MVVLIYGTFWLSVTGSLIMFVLFPVWLLIASWVRPAAAIHLAANQLTVGLIVVSKDEPEILQAKWQNLNDMMPGRHQCSVIVCIDGASVSVQSLAPLDNGMTLITHQTGRHMGKNIALNQAIDVLGDVDILLFTDADTTLPSGIIEQISRYFSDPTVGGVCGRPVVVRNGEAIGGAQRDYLTFDAFIKRLQNRCGSISSGHGQLHAIRRQLYQPLPADVTDDSYIAMSIVHQGFRYIHGPDLEAYIKPPARNPMQELPRRRRIICCSLTGLFQRPDLLNPFSYGLYACNLFVDKVLRRLLPVFLLMLLVSSIAGASQIPLMHAALWVQALFYAVAVLYLPLLRWLWLPAFISRVASLVFYFCLGNAGVLLGWFDYLTGKRVTKW